MTTTKTMEAMLCMACMNMFNLHYLFCSIEHDDRDRAPADISIRKKNGNRRVSFKANAQKSGDFKKLRAAELGLRTHFEDEDERMIEFNGAKAGTFRRRNSPIPSGARHKSKVKLIENASEWFQVNVNIDFIPSFYSFIYIQCYSIVNQMNSK